MVANNPGMVRWRTVYTDVMGSIPTLGIIYYTFVRKRLSYLNGTNFIHYKLSTHQMLLK